MPKERPLTDAQERIMRRLHERGTSGTGRLIQGLIVGMRSLNTLCDRGYIERINEETDSIGIKSYDYRLSEKGRAYFGDK